MKSFLLTLCMLLTLATGAWCSRALNIQPVLLLTEQEADIEDEKAFGFSSPLPKEGPVIKVL